jgi:hypothetical protein
MNLDPTVGLDAIMRVMCDNFPKNTGSTREHMVRKSLKRRKRLSVSFPKKHLLGKVADVAHDGAIVPLTVGFGTVAAANPIRLDTERISRREDEAGCFVLLTNVPTAGDLAHSARDSLTVYKEQHGTEQNYGFLKDPVIVNSLFLKKPERIEALGLVLLLALLIWRLMERAMRRHGDTTSTPLPGWDKKATERPTAFMMVTKFAGVIVLKRGHDRQLARPLSAVQHHYLTALDVPATCFTLPAG